MKLNVTNNIVMIIGALIIIAFTMTVSGAYTNISATRTSEINVANDSNALLSITATGPYASYDQNGALTIDIQSGANISAETDFGKVFTITNNGTKDVDLTIYQFLNGDDVTLTSPLLFSKSPDGNPQYMEAVWHMNLVSGGKVDVYMKLYTNMDEYPCALGDIIDRIEIKAVV